MFGLKRIERKLDWLIAKEVRMVKVLEDLAAQVRANTDAEASAIVVLNGIADRVAAAVTAAIANGASEADLAPVKDEVAALQASAAALSAAVVANTPAA
jgi:hypothetical protein